MSHSCPDDANSVPDCFQVTPGVCWDMSDDDPEDHCNPDVRAGWPDSLDASTPTGSGS